MENISFIKLEEKKDNDFINSTFYLEIVKDLTKEI